MNDIENNERNKSSVILNPERSEWVSRSHVTSVESVVNDGAKTKRYSAKRDLYGDFAYVQPLKMTEKALSFLRLRGASEKRKESSLVQRKSERQAIFKFVLSSASGGAGGGKYNRISAFVSMPVLLIRRSLEKFFKKNFRDDSSCFGFAKVTMLALLFTIATTTESSADDAINCLTGQQSCGTSCCWSVENGKLTITGGKDGTVGTMDDYSWGSTGTNTQWTGNITSIYVSGVKNIGKQAFRNLRQVKDITIGDSVESVDSMAFDNDYALQYVDFGDEITSIGYGALTDASQLMQIIIPDTLNNITNDSFGRNPVAINLQIICRGDKVSCSGIYEKLTKYRSQIDGENQTYDATSLMSYADYKTCTSTNYYWDGAKCVREPDVTKRKCCNSCKDMGGYCNRIRYTPAEAAEVLRDDNSNSVTITFKK